MTIKGMMVYVDEDLYRKFKAKLAANGNTIKTIIHDFITLYVDEKSGEKKNEPEKKGHQKNSKAAKKG